MKKAIKSSIHRPDWILFGVVFALLLFGLLMIFNASPVTSLRDFGDNLYLIRLQLAWAGMGIFLAFVVFLIPYTFWQKIAPFILIGSLVLLAAVLIPAFGLKVYGAQRWLSFGWHSLQPAEFAKIAYIIYISSILSKGVKVKQFLIVTAIFAGILLLQKDLGTTIVLVSAGLAIFFVAGASWWYFLALAPISAILGSVLIILSDYRRARFFCFLNPTADQQGICYHIYQSLLALGSGGVFGIGLGQSRQKYGFIPEVATDSIFDVIGNELGFFGVLILISVFLLLIYRGFKIASNAPDKFSYLLVVGITTWIGIQALINIAGLSALLPLVGVPLPFISYGGSSLVATLIAVAILLNISRYTKQDPINFR
jgi:cell division protein FtsW